MAIKKRIGIVISNKMKKTIVVNIEIRFCHPKYFKIITKTKKYLVHDRLNICNIGDKVLIKETRPLSKQKYWEVNNIISKSVLTN